jgi:hypothetical protein
MRKHLIILALSVFCFILLSASDTAIDRNNDGNPDRWYEISSDGNEVVKSDNNYDGIVDYELEYDEHGRKIREEEDFNSDGEMDDFYYYEHGVLSRHEIDSNFDSLPDIWVYLDEGVYIKRIERDRDFDGKADLVKDY